MLLPAWFPLWSHTPEMLWPSSVFSLSLSEEVTEGIRSNEMQFAREPVSFST